LTSWGANSDYCQVECHTATCPAHHPCGFDIFKALAVGADAVAIGRPYIWGLASIGQVDVERVLDILQSELVANMRQAGTRSIAEINGSYVIDKQRG
jgi:isopentenyl diphosphate isomerase/L-lactate dehydrogenase-like FMN-dependent dehydrogenase